MINNFMIRAFSENMRTALAQNNVYKAEHLVYIKAAKALGITKDEALALKREYEELSANPFSEEDVNPKYQRIEDKSYDMSIDDLGLVYSQEMFGLNQNFYSYFEEVLGPEEWRRTLFSTSNGKKDYLFCLVQEDNGSFVLFGENINSLNFCIKKVFYSSTGIIEKYDCLNRESLKHDFTKGLLSFDNNFNSFLKEIETLENGISTELYNKAGVAKHCCIPFMSLQEDTIGCNFGLRYKYSIYIMSVFSLIEHVAVLILPFWFYSKEYTTNWNNFCLGFHPSGFDTYRDFWDSKYNWIESFVNTLCSYRKHSKDHPASFYGNATELQRKVQKQYEQIRIDYRNPIHHGFSTGSNKTGLSFEVPSLEKPLLIKTPPLLRDVNAYSFYSTANLFHNFLSLLQEHDGEVFKYISKGLNVPVDCTELCAYVKSNTMDDFLLKYQKRYDEKKHELRLFAGGNDFFIPNLD